LSASNLAPTANQSQDQGKNMPIFSLGERRLACASDDYFIAPTASVIGQVKLGHQANIWFNCVLRADGEVIVLGNRANVQDGTIMHSDKGLPIILEDSVAIGHKVMLHGCIIGEGTLVGMNAVVLNGAVIGKNSIVGAHTLVPVGKKFPDGVMLMGTPAKVMRELSPEEQARGRRTCGNYIRRAEEYRRLLKLENA
jgi:carbonic anhydrase/acetyltransferase-like protein (isoleucine patch superfamily)